MTFEDLSNGKGKERKVGPPESKRIEIILHLDDLYRSLYLGEALSIGLPSPPVILLRFFRILNTHTTIITYLTSNTCVHAPLTSVTVIAPHCWKLGVWMTLLPQVKLLRMQFGLQ